MNKTFEATETVITFVPNPTAQTHQVRGLSATTFRSRNADARRPDLAPIFHARMLVGPAGDRVLTMLKVVGPSREAALQALEVKLTQLRDFLNAAEEVHLHG